MTNATEFNAIHTKNSGKYLPSTEQKVLYQVECERGFYQATFLKMNDAYKFEVANRRRNRNDWRVIPVRLVKGG